MGPDDSSATHWVYASPQVWRAFCKLLCNAKDAAHGFCPKPNDHLWVYAHTTSGARESTDRDPGVAWLMKSVSRLLPPVQIHIMGFARPDARLFCGQAESLYVRLPTKIEVIRKVSARNHDSHDSILLARTAHYIALKGICRQVGSLGHAAEKPQESQTDLERKLTELDGELTYYGIRRGPVLDKLLGLVVIVYTHERAVVGETLQIVSENLQLVIEYLWALESATPGPTSEAVKSAAARILRRLNADRYRCEEVNPLKGCLRDIVQAPGCLTNTMLSTVVRFMLVSETKL